MKNLLFVLFACLFTMNAYPAEQPFKTLSIDDFQQENLMKLAKLYSYARYFYPNPYIEEVEWHMYMQKRVQEILEISERAVADSFLQRNFSVFIPQLIISHEKINTPTQQSVSSSFYIKANHLNTGYNKSATHSTIEKMEQADSHKPSPGIYNFHLSTNTYANYPLAVENLPAKTKAFELIVRESKAKWNNGFFTSPYYRIANAIINDAYIQHFYAYYEEDKLDSTWQNSSKAYMQQIASCTSYKEYIQSSYIHYSDVHDSHLYVMNAYYKPNALLGRIEKIYYPDIALKYIEDKICIADTNSKYPNLNIGDEIISANGINIDSLIAKKKKQASASTLASCYQKLCEMFIFQSFKKDSIILLDVRKGNGSIQKVPITTDSQDMRSPEQGEFITQLNNGIWKINPCLSKGAGYSDFCKYIDRFQEAKALIIDVRGYPNESILPILSHFIDSTMMAGQILTPTFYFPDHYKVDYQITPNGRWGIHPSTENHQKEWEYEKPLPIRIKTPVCFLTDHNAISFAETIMEMIKNYQIGTIIGKPTAGTNGDAVILRSPTIGFIFTGHKFLTHQGEVHHGIGVLPDVECHSKIEDLRNNADTQLLKACEFINSKFGE